MFPSKLTPYTDKVTGDHQLGFQHNRSTIDQIFCIRQILEKKYEYSGRVHQLLTGFESVRRQVLFNILIETVIPTKLVTLIKICLN
jgi:hypothetical protein